VGLEEVVFCPPDPAGPPPHAMAVTRMPANAARLRMRFMSTPTCKDFPGETASTYLVVPNTSGKAMLRVMKQKLELLTFARLGAR
jgi:hypothetical protein